jgi:hypothetical protein
MDMEKLSLRDRVLENAISILVTYLPAAAVLGFCKLLEQIIEN